MWRVVGGYQRWTHRRREDHTHGRHIACAAAQQARPFPGRGESTRDNHVCIPPFCWQPQRKQPVQQPLTHMPLCNFGYVAACVFQGSRSRLGHRKATRWIANSVRHPQPVRLTPSDSSQLRQLTPRWEWVSGAIPLQSLLPSNGCHPHVAVTAGFLHQQD